jgi:hypothetical protein
LINLDTLFSLKKWRADHIEVQGGPTVLLLLPNRSYACCVWVGEVEGMLGPRLLVTKDATHLSHSEAVVKSVISNTSDLGCRKRRKRNKEI